MTSRPFALSLSKGLSFFLREERGGLRQAQPERSWFLLLLCLFFLAAPAAAQDFPQLTGRVVDQANLLSPEQEAALTQKLAALEQASSRQLVVVTVPTIGDSTIEDYGYRLGRHWGIGQGQANNGALLIVAVNERKVRIEVGYGLEGILTDALSSQIIRDDILPRFRDNDYPGGIAAGTDAIIQQLQAPPEAAEQRVLAAQQAEQRARDDGGAGALAPIVFWVVVIIVIAALSAGSRRRGGRRFGASPVILWGPGLGGGWGGSDHDDWGGGWGGSGRDDWGGGSSWGGGGGGFGGGGGGFSGGGGSFGGGGASGGW